MAKCSKCTTPYPDELYQCPNCQSTDREEAAMPKISRAAGPSDAADIPAPTEDEVQVSRQNEGTRPVTAEEGASKLSPGKDSDDASKTATRSGTTVRGK